MAREDEELIEEEMVEFDEPADAPEPEELVYDDDAPNLVPIFAETTMGRNALRELSRKFDVDFETAWDASSEARDRRADEWKMFSGDLPNKTYPWDNCANAHVPIVLENISRLQFRTMAELFGDWTNIFGVQPVTPNDQEIADALTKHGNWQIREQIIDFPRQMARGTLLFYLNGDVTAHSFYDPFRKENRHVVLTSEEFVTPYVYCTTMPDYSDCPYIVKILQYHRHQLEAQRGIWYGVDDVIEGAPPPWEDEPDMPLRQAEGEVQGILEPDSDVAAPYKILQYEGWVDLPGQERQRFVQAFIDNATKNIMSLTIYEENDWQDEERYLREEQELDNYRASMEMYSQQSAVLRGAESDALSSPELQPEEKMALQSQFQNAPQMQQPVPPAWIEDEKNLPDAPGPIKKVPVHMFSHGVCIEPLTGDKGLGFGRIQSDYNKAANTALSQFIDAATLANCGIFLTGGSVNLEGTRLTPGMFKSVEGSMGSEIRNEIMPIQFPPANAQLLDVVQKCQDWGQSSIQAPSVLSGEAGKSGETFRGLATRVEQATKQLSVAARNFSFFLTQILKNNARLNAIFLDEQELIQVSAKGMGPEEIMISRDMYKRNYKVVYRSDLKFTSEAARVQEADQMVQLAASLPMLQQNVAFMHTALTKALEARGQDDLIPMLGPAPPTPQTPLGIQPQPAAPPQGAPAPGGEQMPEQAPEPGAPGPGGQLQ